jgi:hypothetical protein
VAIPPRGLAAALLAELERTGAPVLLSVGVRRRVPVAVLERLHGRAVNIHPAFLPAYRGPAPSHALLRDDAFASAGGATLHVMDAKFDTGPVIGRRSVAAPGPRDALGYDLATGAAAAALAVEALPAFLAGRREARPQPEAGGPTAHATLSDVTLGPDWDRARIERLAAALPWTERLRVPGPAKPVQVAGRPRFLPAGAAPGPIGTVQAPWAGGVVRFRRLRGPEQRLWQARRLLRLVTKPIPPPGPEAP